MSVSHSAMRSLELEGLEIFLTSFLRHSPQTTIAFILFPLRLITANSALEKQSRGYCWLSLEFLAKSDCLLFTYTLSERYKERGGGRSADELA